MSKAFTREDDTAEESILPRPMSSLPPGVKNYMTPDGVRRLQDELKQLTEIERPRVAATVDPTGPRRELAALDQRIAYLGQSLQTAVVVEPPASPDEQVRFGATVIVRDKSGTESRYRLVGIDETDMDRNWISWRSPLAGALLNRRVGQQVRFCLPTGEEQLQIVSLSYEV